jgi:putative DNA primase/helicase
MNQQSEAAWRAVTPVPVDAPPPKFLHNQHGYPQAIYHYTNCDGQTCAYYCRYVDQDGKKKILPYCYGYFKGKLGWYWKGLTIGRPIYNAKELKDRPNSPVLVVEGEKAADAGKVNLPNFVVITSSGGANAPHFTDWSMLEGRQVFILGDYDASGQKYAMAVARLCKHMKSKQIRIVELTMDFPGKWDIADPFPEGFSTDDLIRLIEAAPVADSTEVDGKISGDEAAKSVPWPFRMTMTHVEIEVSDKEDNTEWVKVCARLEVAALTHNEDGESWGCLLVFKDANGTIHKWAMPMRMLAGDVKLIREHLLDAGLTLNPHHAARHWLSQYLQICRPAKRIICVARVGWHGDTYVLPDRTFGPRELVLQQEIEIAHAVRACGTLVDWQEKIGKYCIGNSRLSFSVITAFAGPLLMLVGGESGGVHLRGGSSIGKTTLLRVAGSVWGGGGSHGFVRSWRSTANGLEGIAALHNDGFLVLDEMGQAGDDLGDAIYMLANGAGKIRANKSGAARPSHEWRIVFLSSGEISLSAKLNERQRQKATAGQEVRIIDIPADAETGFGVFEHLHGFDSGDKLSRHLKEAAASLYGTPILEFLKLLEKIDRDEISILLKAEFNRLIGKLRFTSADGQVQRVAHRFALFSVAGELAIRFSILPWPSGEASKASEKLLREWVIYRGGTGEHNVGALLRDVQHFFEVYGDSRFSSIKDESETQCTKRAGYHRVLDGSLQYVVLKEVFRREICEGYCPKWAQKILIERGYLVRDGTHATPKVSLPGHEKQLRCYVFTSKIFEADVMSCPPMIGKNGDDGQEDKESNNNGDLEEECVFPN